MKKFMFMCFLYLLFPSLLTVVDAAPVIYNNGEIVELSKKLECIEGDYFIHFDDIALFGIDTDKQSITDGYKYTIEKKDFFATERKLTIEITDKHETINPGDILPPDGYIISEDGRISDAESIGLSSYSVPVIEYDPDDIPKIEIDPDKFYKLNTTTNRKNVKISYDQRKDLQIGTERERFLNNPYTKPSLIFNNIDIKMVYVDYDNELYIHTKLIADKFSKEYTADAEKISFDIEADDFAKIKTCLFRQAYVEVPDGGHKVNVYIAKRICEGDTLECFEIVAKKECIIQEGEDYVVAELTIPTDNTVGNLWYIADYGERFAFIARECDFSDIKDVVVYPWQEDVTLKTKISLPEVDCEDASFKVQVYADNVLYETVGVINTGELSTEVYVRELPIAKKYRARIMFDSKKYFNAWLDEYDVYYIDTAHDFEREYTAKKTYEYSCRVSLPEDFQTGGTIELKARIGVIGGFVATDGINPNEDSVIITLDSENRSKTFTLYGTMSVLCFEYEIQNNVEGLCDRGYFSEGDVTSSDRNRAKELGKSRAVDVTLLKKGMVRAIIKRPPELSAKSDIFANVYFGKVYNRACEEMIALNRIIDQTKPLIKAGETSTEIALEIEEDQKGLLNIVDITGDDSIFSYCSYVGDGRHPLQKDNRRIAYDEEIIEIELVGSVNISGHVFGVPQGIKCYAQAECTLPDGSIVEVKNEVSDGKMLLKIPCGIAGFKLCSYTNAGVKSYYKDDNISTYSATDANFFTDIEDIDGISVEYILQNPKYPVVIDMSEERWFNLKNISDRKIGAYTVYVAYYDEYDKLIEVVRYYDKSAVLDSGLTPSYSYRKDYSGMKTMRIFVWAQDSMTPLCEPGIYVAPSFVTPLNISFI